MFNSYEFGFTINPAKGGNNFYNPELKPSKSYALGYIIYVGNEIYKIGGWNGKLCDLASRYKNGSGKDCKELHTPFLRQAMTKGLKVRFEVEICDAEPRVSIARGGTEFLSKPDGCAIEAVLKKKYFDEYGCYPPGNVGEHRIGRSSK